jgi:hypothetical protein
VTLTAGSRLGLYEIVAALGAGSMDEVYRARDDDDSEPGGLLDRGAGTMR